MLRRLLRNPYILNMTNKIVALLMGVVSNALITRYMGPAFRGEYTYIVSVSAIDSIFLNLGMYEAYPNQVKQGLPQAKQRFMDMFGLQFVLYLALAGVVSLCAWGRGGDSALALEISLIALVTPFSMLMSQVTMVCMVEYPVFRSVILIATSAVDVALTAVVFGLYQGGWIAQGLLLPVLLLVLKNVLLIGAVILKTRAFPRPWRVDFRLLWRVVRFGLLPMLTSLLLNLHYKLDILMLKALTPSAAVGVYSVGVALADHLWLIPDAFKEALFSRGSKSDAVSPFNLSLKLSLVITAAACVALGVLGQVVIRLLYGVEFLGAYGSLVVLLIGIPFMSIFKIINPYFIAHGKTKSYFFTLVCGFAANLIGNSLMIPRWGTQGAAVATVVSQAVCGVVALVLYQRVSRVPWRELATIRQ